MNEFIGVGTRFIKFSDIDSVEETPGECAISLFSRFMGLRIMIVFVLFRIFLKIMSKRRMPKNVFETLLERDPDFVGSIVYFCPTKKNSLPCVVRRDGSISPVCASSLRFDSASKLAQAVKDGQLPPEVEFRIAKNAKPSSFGFERDFLMKPGRKISDDEEPTNPPEQS